MAPDFSDKELDNLFTYHAPKTDQIARYATIRQAGKDFAKLIRDNCPPSADRSVAIRKIREVVMNANASIACNEESADAG